MSELVKLVCIDCGREHYYTYKNKKQHPERLEFNKYCPSECKHTIQREKK